MQSVRRNAFRWAFSAFFGCITLLGQSLHALVEHTDHEAAEPVCAAACHTDSTSESAVSSLDESAHDHDCAICAYFSLAQCLLTAPAEMSGGIVGQHLSLPQSAAVLCQVAGYQSRGPPESAL